jgi:hypothetical protein
MKSRGLLFAAALTVGTNAIVLLGVARNQVGSPLQTIQLTERELPREAGDKENSGVSLRFQWQRFGSSFIDQYDWLGRAKLQELGFDVQAVLRDPKHPPLERPAFLALEYDGPAWEQWLKAMEKEPKVIHPYDSTMESRLFVIDAARRPEPLLEKYKDQQQHYLIMRGVLRLGVVNWDPVTRKPGPDRLQAFVSRLLPESVHVPLPLSAALANLSTGTTFASPRYTVTLSFGRRFEPWIVIQP